MIKTLLQTQLAEAIQTQNGAVAFTKSLRVLVKEERKQAQALKRIAVATKKENVLKRKAQAAGKRIEKTAAREAKRIAKIAKTEARIAKAQAKLDSLKAKALTPKNIRKNQRKASKVTVIDPKAFSDARATRTLGEAA
jgi:hypothetical protein